jgi:hypothetical protein
MHTPRPQLEVLLSKSSSTLPLQSSSTPSQVVSAALSGAAARQAVSTPAVHVDG